MLSHFFCSDIQSHPIQQGLWPSHVDESGRIAAVGDGARASIRGRGTERAQLTAGRSVLGPEACDAEAQVEGLFSNAAWQTLGYRVVTPICDKCCRWRTASAGPPFPAVHCGCHRAYPRIPDSWSSAPARHNQGHHPRGTWRGRASRLSGLLEMQRANSLVSFIDMGVYV